jgi:glycerol-3-phosphate dehydrogenase
MQLRLNNLHKLADRTYDVLILGGGINGAVAAAALSARGASVALIDRGDFAGLTSMQSSNLAWGGIKYMESYEFPLVRKLCMSRNHLIRSYPSSVQEMRFYTTHEKGSRNSRLLLLLGTLAYWVIGNFFTRPPRLLGRGLIEREEPIINVENSDGGIEYSDAYLHDMDARFTWNFVRSAINHGCIAANYVESVGAARKDGLWHVNAREVLKGGTFTIKARALINACGPYADEHNKLTGQETVSHHVFSKGIHLIVPKLTPHKRVLTFFADDGRLFFAIPMGPRTCIGTTDTRMDSPVARVEPEDRKFVLDNINKRLKLERPLTEADIIAERCGVRPLVVKGSGGGNKDWMHLSRKHAVEKNVKDAHVTVFGGKLTDCINVGNEICREMEDLGIKLPHRTRRWYGEPSAEVRDSFFHQAHLMDLDGYTSPHSSEPLSKRLWRRYGSEAFSVLDAVRCDPSMAQLLIENAEYIRAEIELARRYEMVTRLEDFLRRRSKISLVVRREDMLNAPGLKEACRIFFGDEADARFNEYFAQEERHEGHAAPA